MLVCRSLLVPCAMILRQCRHSRILRGGLACVLPATDTPDGRRLIRKRWWRRVACVGMCSSRSFLVSGFWCLVSVSGGKTCCPLDPTFPALRRTGPHALHCSRLVDYRYSARPVPRTRHHVAGTPLGSADPRRFHPGGAIARSVCG
jgi:hypothetical protein